MSKTLLALTLSCFVVASGCTTPGASRARPQSGHAPDASPQVLAVYMPWFGDRSHLDVGYSSQDPAVLRKQIQQARGMGIKGFVVDWYGDSAPFSDRNFALLQETASASHFHVALLYNEPEDEDAEATDAAMAALDRAYKAYIGPEAPYRDAYLTYNGHPMIFIFPKRGHVNWKRVSQRCSDWQATPILLYKDEPPEQFVDNFAGSFAWVQPGKDGWSHDGSNWGQEYLDHFYKTMKNKYPNKITVGAAWPGFDDSSAKWGLNRLMRSRCGKTFDETFNLYQHYYDPSNPLPFLLIETWNDYEEGTAIERRRATDCSDGSPGASAPTSLSGH